MSARVLVVDDVLANVKLLSAKLTREYYEVITALSGAEALEKINAAAPDIVLLDVMMPGIDGFEVCRRIKANPLTAHIPVVMVTALTDVSDRVKGLEAGADDFLTKPLNDIALFARIRSLIRLKFLMDEWRMRYNTSAQLGMAPTGGLPQMEAATGAKVLIVDDSVFDRQRAMETMQRDSHTLTGVGSSAEALALPDLADHDLVIVALTIANDDGLRLCSQLRSNEKTRQVPILVSVDEGDLTKAAKGLEFGVNDYIVKPIDRNELLARARSLIRRKRYQDKLRSNYEESLSLALTDSLTGLFNRRYLLAHLDRLIRSISDHRKPIGVIMFDIDHFKSINDSLGHPAGDDVLRELSARVLAVLRNIDLVARWGGEEFVVVVPDSDLETTLDVGDRIRTAMSEKPFTTITPAGRINVTVSVGVACAAAVSDTPETVIKRADDGLYQAKRDGRNRVRSTESQATSLPVGPGLLEALGERGGY